MMHGHTYIKFKKELYLYLVIFLQILEGEGSHNAV